jgi:hypothetical protein
MKTILTLLLSATAALAAPGEYLFERESATSPKYPKQSLAPLSGQVLRWTATGSTGRLENYDIVTALGLKAPTANPTFTGLVTTASASITGPLSASAISADSIAVTYGNISTSSPGGNVTITSNGAITASGTITGANLSGTNTGDNATNTQYSGLAASKADDNAVVKLTGDQAISGNKTFPYITFSNGDEAVPARIYPAQGTTGAALDNVYLPAAPGTLALTDQASGTLNMDFAEAGTLASARGGTGVNNAGTLGVTTNGNLTFSASGNTLTVPSPGGTAALLGVANVFTAANTISTAQTSTIAPLLLSGGLLGSGTGASGTNSVPYVYHNVGTAPSTWSTGANNGTVFGANEASGFTGNFLDFHVNGGASVFKVDSSGGITGSGVTTALGTVNQLNLATTTVRGSSCFTGSGSSAGTPVRVSPSFTMLGQAWNGTSTRANEAEMYVLPISGATTSGTLIFGTRLIDAVATITTLFSVGFDKAFSIPGTAVVGGSSANANAVLDVQSTTKAFMPPRMTTTQKTAISSPTAGMIVYDTTLGKLCVYTTAWETVTSL